MYFPQSAESTAVVIAAPAEDIAVADLVVPAADSDRFP